MSDIYQALERILTKLPYKETVAKCSSNEMYSRVCNSPGFFERKAKALYYIDLNDPRLKGSTPKERYKYLDDIYRQILNVAKGGLTSIFSFLHNSDIALKIFNNRFNSILPVDFDKAIKNNVPFAIKAWQDYNQRALLRFLKHFKNDTVLGLSVTDQDSWNSEITPLLTMPDHLRNKSAYMCTIFDLLLGDPYEKIIEALETQANPSFINDWLSCEKITKRDIVKAYNWVRSKEPNSHILDILKTFATK